MKLTQTYLVLLLSLFLFSCSETENKNRFTITGKIQNASGEKLIFREMGVDSVKDLDSVVLDEKGLFRFTTRSAEPAFYILKVVSGQGIILSLEKGDEPVINADMADLPFACQVTGSPGSEMLADFFSLTRKNHAKADSLRNILMENRDAPDFYALSLRFDTLFQEVISDQREIEIRFLEKNPSSLASLIVLNYQFGMKPLLNPENDLPLLMKIDSNLTAKHPSNSHVAELHRRITEFMQQKKELQSPVN